ncbi:MAG: hypothetical protein DDT40_01938 [candidate division WS2 bacterium]|nr:hypothetical protein [Candidatus Psychracetigena formicireducens]
MRATRETMVKTMRKILICSRLLLIPTTPSIFSLSVKPPVICNTKPGFNLWLNISLIEEMTWGMAFLSG